MVFDEHKDNAMFRCTRRRNDVPITDKFWWLLLVVAYAHYAFNFTLEDDTKGITIDI